MFVFGEQESGETAVGGQYNRYKGQHEDIILSQSKKLAGGRTSWECVGIDVVQTTKLVHYAEERIQ